MFRTMNKVTRNVAGMLALFKDGFGDVNAWSGKNIKFITEVNL